MSWKRLFASLVFYPQVGFAIYKANLKSRRNRLDPPAVHAFGIEVRKAIESVGVHFDVTGSENLAAGGPFVYISNHMSVLETLVLPGLLPTYPPCTFVIKESLLRYPVFGPVMAALDPIVVTRENPPQDLATVLAEGEKRLRQGKSVVIFPQAARCMDFDAAAFNSLGAKLAQRAGVPIVPVALRTDAWGLGTYIRDIGWIDPSRRTHFAFGRPIPSEDRQANDSVVSFIKAKVEEWDEADPAAPEPVLVPGEHRS